MAEEKEVKKTIKKATKTKPHSATPSAEGFEGSKKATRGDSGFAIIETGGKQYRVAVGDIIKIEKLNNSKVGDQVSFDKVLLIDNGVDSTDVGTPYISGAKVSATVTEIGKNVKVMVIKYKQKSRYFKRNGHRQPFFKVKIDKIS